MSNAPHRLEIKIETVNQLFNSMDPSPFHKKDLDADAEEFIVSWAQEYPSKDPLKLVIHLNQPPVHADPALEGTIRDAVHNYFGYKHRLNRLSFRRLLKQGRASLVIGLVFLTLCLLVSELLIRIERGTLLRLARESLTIAGWVAMWRPMQIFLYDWWPLQRVGRIYEKLSRVPVELKIRAAH